MDEDPFDELFGLEDKYYEEGFQQGLRDGLQQSRLEARLFGIEKGYEKYIEMGKLQARARFWTEDLKKASPQRLDHADVKRDITSVFDDAAAKSRLRKHVDVLTALVDPSTLSTKNTDDAVSTFDDRLKRAKAKCKIIERMLGKQESDTARAGSDSTSRMSANAKLQEF